MTTGLRWSKIMEQKGLIVRKSDPLDRRRVYVCLTNEGDRLMREYLTSIYRRLTP
jgi:DNA-binding MarR family transcriptional regulator